jgi:hypothetical protein
MQQNPFDRDNHANIFSHVLRNTATINSTYHSNHTLEELYPVETAELDALLDLNKRTNKSHVAIRKILEYHQHIDMEPLFEWNQEEEAERNLKALPYIISWFGRAEEAVADEGQGTDKYWYWESVNIDQRKLSAIYQFALAMPLLFEGIRHMLSVGDMP